MSLRSGGLFCPLPDTTAAPADNRPQNRISASHGVRCSLYASSEPFDVEAGPTRLYRPSVRTDTDGAQELRAYIESDSPYIAVQLALEGVSSNLNPLVWQHASPLYARMCMDGSAQPVVERSKSRVCVVCMGGHPPRRLLTSGSFRYPLTPQVFDSHIPNPFFLGKPQRVLAKPSLRSSAELTPACRIETNRVSSSR